jgi:hypothetical protein
MSRQAKIVSFAAKYLPYGRCINSIKISGGKYLPYERCVNSIKKLRWLAQLSRTENPT